MSGTALVAARSRIPTGEPARVACRSWTTAAQFGEGTAAGIAVLPGDQGGLAIAAPSGTESYRDEVRGDTGTWERARWTSPPESLDFGATRVVVSWNAGVPQHTWLRAELRAVMQDGQLTPWLTMANYAYLDTDIARCSASPDAPPFGRVETDTFVSYAGWSVHGYQLRITLLRRPGTAATPRVRRAGAVASAIPPRQAVPPGTPGPAARAGTALAVPAYSQHLHAGHYPRYGGGGEAWCSPASTQMVAAYWGRHPSAADLAWVQPGHPDPAVDYAARHTYDYRYRGTGNWAFNAAYAARFGLDAQIVCLPSMAALETLVAAGLPVITSQSFDRGEIAGAHYRTAGHLWVVTGFTRGGDVAVSDPASPSDAGVPRVLARRQFENAWLRTFWERPDGSAGYGSGGIAYLIRPPELALPPHPDPASPAW